MLPSFQVFLLFLSLANISALRYLLNPRMVTLTSAPFFGTAIFRFINSLNIIAFEQKTNYQINKPIHIPRSSGHVLVKYSGVE